MEEKGKAELESHQPLILFSELQILGHTGSTLVSFTSVVPDIVSYVWKEPTHLVQLQGMITNYINYKVPKGRTLYAWLYNLRIKPHGHLFPSVVGATAKIQQLYK